MAVIRAADNADLLDVSLSKVFFMFLADVPSEYSRWCNVERMDRAWEDYMKAAAFGTVPEKDEGALVQFENIATSDTKRVETKEFALGYVITRKMRDDEKHGVTIRLTQGLRESIQLRPPQRPTFSVSTARRFWLLTIRSSRAAGHRPTSPRLTLT